MPSERKGPDVATEYVHIRHPRTLEEKWIAPHAVPFFSDWEAVVNDGPPAKNAAAEEWRAYTTKHGFITTEEAADKTRAELIALVPATTTEEN